MHPTDALTARRRPTAARLLLNLFSSVWFGIFLLALLFLYCSIGSAVPAVRHHPLLELTEFQWFHWWPFNVLIILFCLAITTVTIRRIPFRPVNAGVLMVHGGIILLIVGSYLYFGSKVEGDTPIFRRRVTIQLPGMRAPQSFPAIPGSKAVVRVGSDTWQFAIQGTNTDWAIVSAEHKGQTAYAVNVRVVPPSGETYIRQLLAGYPQYTEDVIPGKGRAIKTIGRKLIDEDLHLALDFEPQEYFHVMDTWALFVRRVGETEWSQRPIRGLPRYHERIGARDQVWMDPHFPLPLRSIDLDVPPLPSGDALSEAEVRITGYLRYAQMRRRWQDGGDRLNPVLRISVLAPHGEPQSYEMIAFDPARNQLEGMTVQFVWLETSAMIDALSRDSRALLHVEVPDAEVKFDLALTPEVIVGREGAFTRIAGSDFAYRVLNIVDDLAMPGGRQPVSIAMVEIKTPQGRFTRMVADQAESTRDMHGGASSPHDPHASQVGRVDPRIRMTYRPRSAPVIFAAHPQGLYCAVNGDTGRILGREVNVGEVVEVVPGLKMRVDALWLHAVAEVKPFVVPPPSRNRDAGITFAMIRMEVDPGGGTEAKWLRFNQYALPSEQYAYAGRLAYQPERFRLRDGSWVEVLFSRERRRLPSPIAMEDFRLDTHTGGYTGSTSTIRNYVSRLRFLDDGQWSEPKPIAVNHPTEHGGYWYFQSMWDRPPSNNPGGGMNYTGLGVGNRKGVHVQLVGCCFVVSGLLFAFYVKPTLKRRGAGRRQAGIRRTEDEETDVEAQVSVLEPTGV